MRPFPGDRIPRRKSIYNYRLSRARMVVECAFGILATRWRVLLTPINMTTENVDSVVLATCILHNYLLNPAQNNRLLDEAQEEGLGGLPEVRNMGGNRGGLEAQGVREKFCAFFNSAEGSVPWQERMV